MKKFPKGTLVFAYYSLEDGSYIPLITDCENHPFRLTSKPKKVEWGCGWAQSAECVICERSLGPITIEAFQHRISERELRGVIQELRLEIGRLTDIKTALSLTRMELRNQKGSGTLSRKRSGGTARKEQS